MVVPVTLYGVVQTGLVVSIMLHGLRTGLVVSVTLYGLVWTGLVGFGTTRSGLELL